MSDRRWTVLVTGGAGYVGSVLIPKLLAEGHDVRVLDLYLYGREIFADHRGPRLTEIQGDLRDPKIVAEAVRGCDAVIHLACISNDPSFDLDPDLGRSINYDCFRPLVRAAKAAGVERFVYASSSSVYGLKDIPNVTEDESLEPMTDYAKYKALCEDVLAEERQPGFTTLTVRPATVCGYGPRLRLDLTVNILTSHGYNNKKITVFGGSQKRPNLHIEDMVEFYLESLRQPHEKIDGRTYNVGFENHTVMKIAEMVRDVVGKGTEIVVTPTDDLRSYHISSDKIRRELGFVARHTITDAAEDLVRAFRDGKIPNWSSDPRYVNIKLMKAVSLQVRSIGLDFDNTLVDYTEVFRAEAAAFGIEAGALDKTGIRDRLRALGTDGEIAWQKVQARVYGPGLERAPVMAGGRDFLRRAAAAGCALAVVSHKGRFAAQDPGGVDLRAAARRWLARHCPEIPADRVFFEDERAGKLGRIASLGLTHFVDDLPEVLSDPAFPPTVHRLWLIARPGDERPSGLFAAGPWPDLAEAMFGR